MQMIFSLSFLVLSNRNTDKENAQTTHHHADKHPTSEKEQPHCMLSVGRLSTTHMNL